jgi:energy-coupling factor transporter ATP-binding protein EcfA2
LKLLALSIDGFRGISHANIRFGDHDVLVGPNGAGKSTIVDALSLVFGRTRLVRELTEHDFHGSCPDVTSRIRIVATMGGFEGNDPDHHDAWFREGRAVPKWWDRPSGTVMPQPANGAELCVQIGFGARFDLGQLVVETIRYFHDDDDVHDPFLEETLQQIPLRLFDEVGYYVLPARRTWDAAASFASELFRRAVATVGGVPAQTVLEERDRLRQPQSPLEEDLGLGQLVERVNRQLAQLLPRAPQFKLRVTATDSESLLHALVPHYGAEIGTALPVGRHGTGLLSLQTFILLLELGRERRRQGKPFLFAMEEPELHIPPGMQRRLVAQAVSIAQQTICTTHSPRVASFFPAISVQILEHRATGVSSTPMLASPLNNSASNALRKLCHDDRPRVVEGLMQHRVLIPEGRTEYEWLRLLADLLETTEPTEALIESDIPAFGTVVGVIPTHDSAVVETYRVLRRLRGGLVPMIDGDGVGDAKILELLGEEHCPPIILQWQKDWTTEDGIGWILKADEKNAVDALSPRIEHAFKTIDDLVNLFKVKTGPGRLKVNYLAYEEVASVVGALAACRRRAATLMEAVTRACLDQHGTCELLVLDEERSSERSTVLRVTP